MVCPLCHGYDAPSLSLPMSSTGFSPRNQIVDIKATFSLISHFFGQCTQTSKRFSIYGVYCFPNSKG